MKKNKEIIIIGIDQGYANLGIAILGYNLESKQISFKEAKTITTSPKEEMTIRLKQIFDDVYGMLKNYKNIKFAGCERLFHNNVQKNGRNKSANIMYTNMATGVLYYLCAKKKIPMKEYAPTTVKKVLTGSGKATKEEVEQALNDLIEKYKIEVKSNHESDAIAIALTIINKEL